MRRSNEDAASERMACGLHAPASEIHSQERVAHAPAHRRCIGLVLVADRSGNTQEQGGGAHVWR